MKLMQVAVAKKEKVENKLRKKLKEKKKKLKNIARGTTDPGY